MLKQSMYHYKFNKVASLDYSNMQSCDSVYIPMFLYSHVSGEVSDIRNKLYTIILIFTYIFVQIHLDMSIMVQLLFLSQPDFNIPFHVNKHTCSSKVHNEYFKG